MDDSSLPAEQLKQQQQEEVVDDNNIDEMIAKAAAAAVTAAESNLRSDSILSLDDSNIEDFRRHSSASLLPAAAAAAAAAAELSEDAFIEFESIEATEGVQQTELSSRGKFLLLDDSSEFRSSMESAASDMTSSLSVREWEDDKVSAAAPEKSAPEEETESCSHQESLAQEQQQQDEEQQLLPESVQGILQACGALPLSLDRLQGLWMQSEGHSTNEVYESRAATDTEFPALTDQFSYSIRRSSYVPDSDVLLLHSLFASFCQPPPSLEDVEKIYDMEKMSDPTGHSIDLPNDVLISVSTAQKGSVIKLLLYHRHLLHLPKAFQLAFFRILVRLLTNKTDEEYDEDCLTSPLKLSDDEDVDPNLFDSKRASLRATFESSSSSSSSKKVADLQKATHERVQRMRARRESIDKHRKDQSQFVERMRQSESKQLASKRPNQVYAIVRFHAGDAWKGKTAVSVLLELLDVVRNSHQHLLPPVITLIGLVCTAGVAVNELQRMLQIAAEPVVKSSNVLDRLLMVRALTTAAEGDSQSTFLVGKASPKYFFTFGKSPNGLSRTITSLSNWPFRNDFGVAVWFRCESFDQSEHPTLVSISSPQGAGVDVSLMPLEGDKTATVIVVTVRDAGTTEVERAIVRNCVLLPRVWYHLGIRHTRSRMKGVFSLSARQQVSVLLDGKLMLTEPLKFPTTSCQENGVASTPKSFLSGLQISKVHTTSLTVQFGAHFEGQAGALYLFNDNVSDATLRALYHVTAGTRNGLVKKDPLSDSNWDLKNSIGKAVVELNSIDADEVVMAQQQTPRMKRWSSAVVDLSEAEESETDVLPELSRSALHSKLFLVWDPKRTEASVAIDLHSGAHVTMDSNYVQPSCVDGAKNVIASIGGVQALLPIFDSLLSGTVEEHWEQRNADDDPRIQKSQQAAKSLVPTLFSMMAAFLRSHDQNAREMMRCGGIDIVEQRLLQNKELDSSTKSLVGVLRTNSSLASLLVDSLLDLRLACEHYVALETTVFSRLLFNMPLWFGGSCLPTGISLYPTLLPVLSSLTKATPHKVRNTVGVRQLVELLQLYTDIGETKVRDTDSIALAKLLRPNHFCRRNCQSLPGNQQQSSSIGVKLLDCQLTRPSQSESAAM